MTGVGDRHLVFLHVYAEMGDWESINAKIMGNSGAVFDSNSSGKTVLHIAVIFGHERIVERLVNILQEEVIERLLIMQDNDGYTALALVAQLNGSMRMARCMVEKNQELLPSETSDRPIQDLLTMKTNDNQIPLVLASAMGHKQLTRYLYSLTPGNLLSENNSCYAIMLLLNCISAKIFGKISSSSFLACAEMRRFSFMMLNAVPYHDFKILEGRGMLA